ncbi:S1 family peptidase [Dyadobacter bucti]|uniref:S1 family peptidase n=1 Tax=Dyadobacter bucti TaxID=2572203 RepID=UPI00140A708D|nr:serine protease [Dyadobacter bucti]
MGFASCGIEKASGDLDEMYGSAVVLIRTESVYQLSLNEYGAQTVFYLTFNSQTQKTAIYEKKVDAFANSEVTEGTGFFIDRKGRIATNRHVVGTFSQQDKRQLMTLMRDYSSEFLRTLRQKEDELVVSIRESYEDNIEDLQEQLATTREWIATYNRLFAMLDGGSLTEESRVSVAYKNNFSGKSSSYHEVDVVFQSEDDEVDLAVLQLPNRNTPEQVIEFYVPTYEEAKEIIFEPLDPVVIIGYNLGSEVGETPQGLQAQLLRGNISQAATHPIRIMYNISTESGSSGSPVLDEDGNLLAVNYAGRINTQLKYGIRIEHLARILDENNLREIPE